MATIAAGLRRGAVCALGLIPTVVGVYVLVAWAIDASWATRATWATLIGGTLIAALVPASARLVARAARAAGQPISGFFASMYGLTIGLAYVIGGLVVVEPAAIISGAIGGVLSTMPFAVGRFGQTTAPAIWLVLAVIWSAAAALLMVVYGLGLALIAPAWGAWKARGHHKARHARPVEVTQAA
jgi:hypothetical protein